MVENQKGWKQGVEEKGGGECKWHHLTLLPLSTDRPTLASLTPREIGAEFFLPLLLLRRHSAGREEIKSLSLPPALTPYTVICQHYLVDTEITHMGERAGIF